MNFEDYVNKMDSPSFRKPRKPVLATLNPTREDLDVYRAALEAYEEEKTAWDQAWKAWKAEDRRLYEWFIKDALDELELTDHPKAALLVSLARQRGGGITDIFYAMEEMAELLR